MPTILSDSFFVLSGLNLMGSEDSGVEWVTEKADGWEGSPASTLTVTQRPRSSGVWAGYAYSTERNIAINGWVLAPNRDLLQDAIDRLNAAVALESTLLTFTEPGRTLSCRVRRNGEVICNIQGLEAQWSIQLVATDSRKFAPALTGSTALRASSGGLAVPFSVPFAIGAVSTSGQVSLTNTGNEVGQVFFRIDGPVNGASITQMGSNKTVRFSSSLVLGSGEWLDIDNDRRSVLANGQSSRGGYVVERGWSQFEVGPNTWSFDAALFTAGALLTVTAFPATK